MPYSAEALTDRDAVPPGASIHDSPLSSTTIDDERDRRRATAAAAMNARPAVVSRHGACFAAMLADMSLVLAGAFIIGIAGSQGNAVATDQAMLALSLLGMTLVGLMRLFGGYSFAALVSPVRRLAGLTGALLFLAAGSSAAVRLVEVDPGMARLVGPWAVLVTAALALATIPLNRIVDRMRAAGRFAPSVAIVGATAIAERLAAQSRAAPYPPFEIVGIFDDRVTRVGATLGDLPVLGTTEDLLHFQAIDRLDWIIVALPWSAEQRVAGLLDRLRTVSTRTLLAPDMVGLRLGEAFAGAGDGPTLIEVLGRPMDGGRRLIKELEDRVLGALLTLLLLPVMAMVALAVRIDSPGPVLFRQRRIGYAGRAFDVLKFRTLKSDMADADAVHQVSEKDPRVTRLGWFLRKYSLDELPQLFNVLRGEMSLVGPRPYATGMMAGTTPAQDVLIEYARRRRIKPGMTGWSQVNGGHGPIRNEADLRRRLEHDLDYINNWSLWFDLVILCMTVGVVAHGRRLTHEPHRPSLPSRLERRQSP